MFVAPTALQSLPALPHVPWLAQLGTLAMVVGVCLLVAGVGGSLLPAVPGPLLSLAGLACYWAGTGFSDPGPLVLTALVVVALAALAVDWSGGLVAAKAGGASTRTSLLAGFVGIVLAFFTGPLGVVAGIAGTVFAVELYRTRSVDASFRTASLTTLSLLGTGLLQALLTATVLLGVVVVHVL